jgi:hypothetical protein
VLPSYRLTRPTFPNCNRPFFVSSIEGILDRAHLNAPTGPLAGQHSSTLTLVLLRSGEKWKIAAFHNTLVKPPSPG